MPKKKNEITIRSSVAEYLTFVASSGSDEQRIEMHERYYGKCSFHTVKNFVLKVKWFE